MDRKYHGISIEEVLDLFPPMQHKAEFLWLWDQLPNLGNVLEIGMGYGATAALFSFCGAQVTTIDPKEPESPWTFDNEIYIFDLPDFKELVWWAKPVKWIRKLSTESGLVDEVRLPVKYDLLHIDGDHSYEVAHSDWTTFGPLAKLVAVHDIFGWDQDVHWKDGPRGLWSELHRDDRYNPRECCLFNSGGIGLVDWVEIGT